MARNPEALQRFHNNFEINLISRNIKSPFLDSFEGTLMIDCTFHYFSSNRDKSLADMLNNLRWMKEVAVQMERLLLSVNHLHEMGFVHRNLSPEVVFQSLDDVRPLFIAGHEYTT